MAYLLIDIGNSRLKIAIATSDKRTDKIIMSTGLVIEEPLDVFILEYITSNGYAIGDIRTALISSVVPEYNTTLTMACSHLGIQALFVTQDIPLPLTCAFPVPPMVGVDRLLLGYGASVLYPTQPVIIVSFGTATTFNCIENNIFLGGYIFAGVMQSLHSLLQNASQLRATFVDIHMKKENAPLITQQAEESITYGFTEGFASMAEGMLTKLASAFITKPIFIASGGMAPLISSYTTYFDLVNEDLVLDAMFYLIQNNKVPACYS